MQVVSPIDAALQIKRTFLREINLSSFRDTDESSRAERGGFWKRVLNRENERKRDPSYRLVTVMDISIGGWVNLPPNIRHAVNLQLEWEDNEGVHTIMVDEMNARGATQVLLSGTSEIVINGRLRSMKIYCGGVEHSLVWIDNFTLGIDQKSSSYLRTAS